MTMDREYIEREVVSEGIRKYYYKNPPNSSYQEGFDHGLDKAQRVILNAPVADVVEVRHGQKLRPRRRSSKCCCDDSTCNGGVIRNTNQRYPNGLYPICPHCGAKLDIKRCLRRNSDDANIRRYY